MSIEKSARHFDRNELEARKRGWFDFANSCREQAHLLRAYERAPEHFRGMTYGKDPASDQVDQ